MFTGYGNGVILQYLSMQYRWIIGGGMFCFMEIQMIHWGNVCQKSKFSINSDEYFLMPNYE